MSGELFGAETMESWGVVSLVFDDEGFDEGARAYAVELAAGPTKAHPLKPGHQPGPIECP
jgi:enoyl-CoA hydratase/carnithine racemase